MIWRSIDIKEHANFGVGVYTFTTRNTPEKKERKKERLNDGNNNGQATHGSQNHEHEHGVQNSADLESRYSCFRVAGQDV